MERSILENAKVVPKSVRSSSLPNRYSLDLTGFETGLVGVTITSLIELEIECGQDCVEIVVQPTLNIASTPHTVGWTLWGIAAGDVIGTIWFKVSNGESYPLGWTLEVDS